MNPNRIGKRRDCSGAPGPSVVGARAGLSATVRLAAFSVFSLLLPAHGQWMPIRGEDDAPPPSGPEIMEKVRAGFPSEPLVLTARLERRNAGPREKESFRVHLRLDGSAEPPLADLRLADAFGRTLVEGRVLYRPEGAEIRLRDAAPPDPDASLLGTDFSWGDLSLSFLWWPEGTLRGFESHRGRRCFVVDLPSPNPSSEVASIRLWIDAYVHALLQAEIRKADGTPTRRLSVQSLRRIGLHWTLEDLEMRNLQTGTRTLLRVEELYTEGPEEEP